MKFSRDTIRTILALLLIIIIVVATFAYGNAQRNKQKASNDAKVTETQTKEESTNEKSATVTTTPPATPSTPTSGTTTPATTTPDTGGHAQVQPATMPETGAETSYGIPLAIVALVGYFYLRSRQRLSFAQNK